VLGASVAEAVAGKKMGNKAALWGAIAGTIPDLDVFLNSFFHPIDAALVHRGFTHSIFFAFLAAPIVGWLLYRLYKCRYEKKLWIQLWFLATITHPMLDMFTNYGTQFLWPLKERITFNTVFVIDPLYTLPFLTCLLVALFLRRERPARWKWNMAGLLWSNVYLLWGVVIKLSMLWNANSYLAENGLKTRNAMVTPMPLTSFYWMMLAEDDQNYYVGYKSLFYPFQPSDTDTISKNKSLLDQVKWPNKNYSETLKYISNGYYTTEISNDTLYYYDLRFGLITKATNGKVKKPMMGYGMVIDKGYVQKTENFRGRGMAQHLNFSAYVKKIFYDE
jgi:inner membrane protein